MNGEEGMSTVGNSEEIHGNRSQGTRLPNVSQTRSKHVVAAK